MSERSEDYTPTPNAEPVFFKTSAGCVIEWEDPEARERANTRRVEWAREYKRQHGEYPSGEMQIDFQVRVIEEEEQAARRRALMTNRRTPDSPPPAKPGEI